MTGIAGYSQRVAAVCAGIAEAVHLVGRDRAIFQHAGLEFDPHRVACARANEFLFTCHFVEHRTSSRNRQMSSDIFNQHFLLAAKPAADSGFDHSDALDRQV